VDQLDVLIVFSICGRDPVSTSFSAFLLVCGHGTTLKCQASSYAIAQS